MKNLPRYLALLAICAFAVSGFAQQKANHKNIHSGISPFLQVGPMAIPASVSPSDAGTNYGLFTCQVGRSAATCYDPYQMRHAYGIDKLVNAGFDGKGKTIVIVDAFQSPNIAQTLNSFDGFYGLPGLNGTGNAQNNNFGTFTQVAPDGLTTFNPLDGNMIGWAEEISLDVEWAHAIAPGANITLVLAKTNSSEDILNATKYAVDNNLGDVISQSFGENEGCLDQSFVDVQHQVFADATAKNITLFASAGDFGATQGSCDGKSLVKAASSPATDPLVTAVGGTELHAAGYCLASLHCDATKNPAAGTHQGEIVWNESEQFAGGEATGGGLSVVFDQPADQRALLHDGQLRGAPDVSYNAAVEHGVLTVLNIPGLTDGFKQPVFFLFGGTSAGSPQWAAITAIADQAAGHNLGYINAALYHAGQAKQTYATSFYDVTSGDNSFAGIAGFSAAPGWDATTGLGSPVADQIVGGLIQHVSAGDGMAAIAQSKPHSNAKPNSNGNVTPH
jgi:subtilase family serine protease